MSLNSLLNQTIAYKNPTGTRDLHGKQAFGASTTIRARFERVYKTIVTPNREREPIDAIAMISPSSAVEVGARVVFGSDTYRVMARSDAPGANGSIHHYELMLQLWSFAS